MERERPVFTFAVRFRFARISAKLGVPPGLYTDLKPLVALFAWTVVFVTRDRTRKLPPHRPTETLRHETKLRQHKLSKPRKCRRDFKQSSKFGRQERQRYVAYDDLRARTAVPVCKATSMNNPMKIPSIPQGAAASPMM